MQVSAIFYEESVLTLNAVEFLEVEFTVKTMKLSDFCGHFLKKLIKADERVLKNERATSST